VLVGGQLLLLPILKAQILSYERLVRERERNSVWRGSKKKRGKTLGLRVESLCSFIFVSLYV